jgi:hypothetical protein
MYDPSEYGIVATAFRMACGAAGYVTGYVEWSEKWRPHSRSPLAALGLTPEGVRDLVIEHVIQGGVVEQVKEVDSGRERDFHYRVFLELDGIPGPVYVKMTLFDDDPDNPVVHIVSAHKEGV